MQQTTNLSLELYEATDNANLLDGYNASMRKIDAHEGTQDGLITLAQNTANAAATAATAADARAVTADAKATDATTAAGTAQETASSAATAAASALTQLGGMHIQHIHNDDQGTLWTAGTWASAECSFNAVVLYDEVDGHGILIGEFRAKSNATTPTTAWDPHYVVTLRDWGLDTEEGNDAYGYVRVINDDWYDAGTLSRFNANGQLSWQVFNGASSSLPAGELVTGHIISQVIRRV